MRRPSYNFLGFVDWLMIHEQRFRAIADLLCWIGHGLSEDECHRLSVLLESLSDDLRRKTEAEHSAWRKGVAA